MSRPAGLAALLIAGLALSGCMTDGYGRSYGSVSVGSGWYDDYGYPGYYPGYYGYDYGYRDSPGYYHVPRHRHSSRWKDRKPDGKWEGRRHSDKSRWSGKDRAEARERWRERSTEAEVKRVPSRIERRHMNQSRPGFQGRPPRAERSKDRR